MKNKDLYILKLNEARSNFDLLLSTSDSNILESDKLFTDDNTKYSFPMLLADGKLKSYEKCKILSLHYIIEIISTKKFTSKEDDIIFMWLTYYDDNLSEDDFIKYLRYSTKGTFFSENSNLTWLLDLFYCILNNNLDGFEYFNKENTSKIEGEISKDFYIDSIKRIYISVKQYKITSEEKQILLLIEPTFSNIRILSERYPIILIKFLKFLLSYDIYQYNKVVLMFIENFRYTDFYDKMMVSWYS